jgi:bidirectional [NiFe] hydrogenase diaphorase subunit
MSEQKKRVKVTIDGRVIEAEAGRTVLEVASEHGIKIPTLCHHPGVEPFGACRLCVVEIRKQGWTDDWSEIVTSCLYPVEEGLNIQTQSEPVVDNRKVIMDLMLARTPDSDLIRSIANDLGVYETSYTVRENADKCILCGICVRVCETIGCSAISTLARGQDKYVDVPDKDACIGCLACANTCPTGHIEYTEEDGVREIWGRKFDLVQCATSGAYLATEEQIDHFSEKSGLAKDYFTKSDVVRKKETAITAARVMFK